MPTNTHRRFLKTRHTPNQLPAWSPLHQSMTPMTMARCSVEVCGDKCGWFRYLVSHKVSEKSDVVAALQEALCEAVRKEVGILPPDRYRTGLPAFLSPEIPLEVILSPYLFKKVKPLSWCLSFSQERASFCRAFGMYIRRSFPPFEHKSKCPQLDVFHLDLYGAH